MENGQRCSEMPILRFAEISKFLGGVKIKNLGTTSINQSYDQVNQLITVLLIKSSLYLRCLLFILIMLAHTIFEIVDNKN